MAEKKSFLEEVTKGIADAITDIREKVVEEPWFGRVVNDREVTELNFGWPQAPAVQPEQGEHEPDHQRDAADHEMDR